MTSIKLPDVKVIFRTLCLIFILSFVFPNFTYAAQKYSIQIAASKSPLDIPYFSKKHHITEPIREVISEDWCRYFIGEFETLAEASAYTKDLVQTNGINGAFPCKISYFKPNIANVDTVITPTKEESTIIKDTVISESNLQKSSEETFSQVKEEAKSSNAPEGDSQLIQWVFGKKNLEDLKLELIRYGKNNFSHLFRKAYISLVGKVYEYPLILVFLIMIFIFLVNVILVLWVLYFVNKQKNRKERYIRIYLSLYEEVMQLYLFGEISWEKALVKFKRLERPLNRKIFTSVLLNYKENLRGEMDAQIYDIFLKLGLNKDSIKLAESRWYHMKVQGMIELTNLYPEGAKMIVPKYLNNSHELVRTESHISYIRLHPDEPFAFLKTLKSPFSRWTQLSAFYLLRLHQLQVPTFVDYLDSKLPTVQNFCLRMIIFFQQIEDSTEIFKMLDSKEEMTRSLAIRAINDLRLFDGKELIKNMYENETPKNKLEIIRAMRNLGDTEDFEFLESIILSASVSLKTEACRSLYFMDQLGKQRLTQLSEDADLKIDEYLAHITDPRN